MSDAVICDECGLIFKERDTVRVADALCSSGFLYGAHICSSCWPKFNTSFDVYGHHVRLPKLSSNSSTRTNHAC